MYVYRLAITAQRVWDARSPGPAYGNRRTKTVKLGALAASAARRVCGGIAAACKPCPDVQDNTYWWPRLNANHANHPAKGQASLPPVAFSSRATAFRYDKHSRLITHAYTTIVCSSQGHSKQEGVPPKSPASGQRCSVCVCGCIDCNDVNLLLVLRVSGHLIPSSGTERASACSNYDTATWMTWRHVTPTSQASLAKASSS